MHMQAADDAGLLGMHYSPWSMRARVDDFDPKADNHEWTNSRVYSQMAMHLVVKVNTMP